MTRLERRIEEMCAKAAARFALANDLLLNGDMEAAVRQKGIGRRMAKKAWKAQDKQRLKGQATRNRA